MDFIELCFLAGEVKLFISTNFLKLWEISATLLMVVEFVVIEDIVLLCFVFIVLKS